MMSRHERSEENAAREVALRRHGKAVCREPSLLEKDWYRAGWRDAREHLRAIVDESIRDLTIANEALTTDLQMATQRLRELERQLAERDADGGRGK